MKAKDLKSIEELDDLLGVEPLTARDIYKRAEKGDVTILFDRSVSKAADAYGSQSPLHHLANKGKIEVLQHPDVAIVQDRNKVTPLHLLAGSGKVEALLHPAAGTIKDNTGNTPLHYAARAIVFEALEHPAAATAKNDGKETALHILARMGCPLALEHKDVANVKGPRGATPLHYLAEAGVDVTEHPQANIAKDNHGNTPAEKYDGMTNIQRIQKRDAQRQAKGGSR